MQNNPPYQPIKKEIRAGKRPSDIPYHSGIITMVRLKASKIKDNNQTSQSTRIVLFRRQFPVNRNIKSNTSQSHFNLDEAAHEKLNKTP
jgi:hypothetical protein